MYNLLTKYRGFWICSILALITAATFFQVYNYDFVNYDDFAYVYENPNIQEGITLKAIKWAFTTGHTSNWHPLTWLSHMLDWQLFGPEVGGHHLVSLILHIANTLLLFIVLKEMTQCFWQSAFVAALFALHPLHVESVAWVSERKDVLSTFFWMLTMWAYLRYIKRPRAVRYLLMLLAFALGLMSKPMLVTLPFVLLLLDYWPLARISYERGAIYHLIWEKIPFFVLSAISSFVTFLVQRGGGAVAKIAGLSLKIRIFNALISYVEYIIKMFWPVNLAVFYPHPDRNVSVLYAVMSAVFLLAVTIFVLRFTKNHRYLFTGWFWYLGTLVPVVGLIQVGQQAMADRYTYITLTGLFIIIAWGVPELLAKWRYKKITLILSAPAVIAALSVCTYFQVHYWKNSLALFQHALDVTKGNYIAHERIAAYLYGQGRVDETIYHYKKAIEINPLDSGAYLNFGAVLIAEGRFEEAGECFIKVLRLNPNSEKAHYYFGQVLSQKGKVGEAIKHFEEALRLKPDWADPMNDLAWYLAASRETAIRNPERATGLARRACELSDYKKPEFLDTLAAAYAAAGDFGKAVETVERALTLCQSPEQKSLREEIENRLALYKAGEPYIEAQ
jgi:tetratricopeptide (TPR) repeat protein